MWPHYHIRQEKEQSSLENAAFCPNRFHYVHLSVSGEDRFPTATTLVKRKVKQNSLGSYCTQAPWAHEAQSLGSPHIEMNGCAWLYLAIHQCVHNHLYGICLFSRKIILYILGIRIIWLNITLGLGVWGHVQEALPTVFCHKQEKIFRSAPSRQLAQFLGHILLSKPLIIILDIISCKKIIQPLFWFHHCFWIYNTMQESISQLYHSYCKEYLTKLKDTSSFLYVQLS